MKVWDSVLIDKLRAKELVLQHKSVLPITTIAFSIINMISEQKEEMANNNNDASESPPPVLGSWRNLYLLVLGNLALMVVVFYLFTLAYR